MRVPRRVSRRVRARRPSLESVHPQNMIRYVFLGTNDDASPRRRVSLSLPPRARRDGGGPPRAHVGVREPGAAARVARGAAVERALRGVRATATRSGRSRPGVAPRRCVVRSRPLSSPIVAPRRRSRLTRARAPRPPSPALVRLGRVRGDRHRRAHGHRPRGRRSPRASGRDRARRLPHPRRGARRSRRDSPRAPRRPPRAPRRRPRAPPRHPRVQRRARRRRNGAEGARRNAKPPPPPPPPPPRALRRRDGRAMATPRRRRRGEGPRGRGRMGARRRRQRARPRRAHGDALSRERAREARARGLRRVVHPQGRVPGGSGPMVRRRGGGVELGASSSSATRRRSLLGRRWFFVTLSASASAGIPA